MIAIISLLRAVAIGREFDRAGANLLPGARATRKPVEPFVEASSVKG
jgi:hypothetical protein